MGGASMGTLRGCFLILVSGASPNYRKFLRLAERNGNQFYVCSLENGKVRAAVSRKREKYSECLAQMDHHEFLKRTAD